MFIRGFKTWCEGVSLLLRKELGVGNTAPLNPRALATYLGVKVLSPCQLEGLSSPVCNRLLSRHADTWSAITVSNETERLIVYNSSHSPARQSSDITHELAHLLLDHAPTQVFVAPGKSLALRTHDKNQEDEANWLSGALLLPREALMHIRRGRLTEEAACKTYGVSRDLLRYRLNVTGVDLQLRRSKGSRG